MRADFYTFWVSWVLPLSIRDFVGLARFFSRKKVQEGLASKPFVLVWTVWKAQNRIAFDNEVFSIQKLKRDFVCFLWVESKLFLNDCPPTLGFFESLGNYSGSYSVLICLSLGGEGRFVFLYSLDCFFLAALLILI